MLEVSPDIDFHWRKLLPMANTGVILSKTQQKTNTKIFYKDSLFIIFSYDKFVCMCFSARAIKDNTVL